MASRPAQLPDPGEEDDYEVMTRVGGRPGGEATKPTVVVLKEPGAAALGGTVNLLLSLRSTGDSQVQVLEPPAGVEVELQEEAFEPVHRVRRCSEPHTTTSVPLYVLVSYESNISNTQKLRISHSLYF